MPLNSFTLSYSIRILYKVNKYINRFKIGIPKIKIAKIKVFTVKGPLSKMIQRINSANDEK